MDAGLIADIRTLEEVILNILETHVPKARPNALVDPVVTLIPLKTCVSVEIRGRIIRREEMGKEGWKDRVRRWKE